MSTVSKFKTHDNDSAIGVKFPSIETLVQVNDAKTYPLPADGEVYVALFWGKFHKPGYKFLPLYSQLIKDHEGLKVVAISIDPEISYPQAFLEDPKKKYSSVFTTEMNVSFDEGKTLKGALTPILRDSLMVPHAFLVDKTGTIVWHQNHSELGATAPSYMDLMEAAIVAALKGEPVPKVGDKEIIEDSDSESSSAPEDGEQGGNMGDFW
jgi:thiol-disulfide isomerase/thioredoxin